MSILKQNITILLLLLYTISTAAGISENDRRILQRFWQYAERHNLKELPVSQRIIPIAHFFIGTPYKSHTLEVSQKDLPVINLRAFDCVTFVENVLALAYLAEYNDSSTRQFVQNIMLLRYRDGQALDYTSRLHYSSDWLYEMQRQNILTDLTRFAGGILRQDKVSFMSDHSERYPALKSNPELLARIKEIEKNINQREHYYIPKDKINESCPRIREGDVILITTNIKGLDTSHLGFALKKNGQTYLVHASSDGKKVMISKNPLQDYMADIRSQSGIMVGRATKCLAQDLIEIQ